MDDDDVSLREAVAALSIVVLVSLFLLRFIGPGFA